jgi:hypothetical protein
MRFLYYKIFFRLLMVVLLLGSSTVFGQFGRAAKRAALKTRNKQISRFTVRTDFSKSKKYISFGGGAGISNYFGDLAPNNTRTSTNMGYTRTYLTGYYLQRVHPNVTIRGALSWMQLRGDDYSVLSASSPDGVDLGRFRRNLSFRNNIFEMSAVGIFELFPTDRGYLRRTFVNPYALLGLSVFTHNPSTKTPVPTKPGDPKSEWVNLRPLGTEGQFTGVAGTPKPYSLLQLGVPIGLGVRYRLLDKWDLSLELGYRFVFTDYIDDVSGKYPSEEVYQEMYNQGNYAGISMSNRSAELYAAVEVQRRTDALKVIARAFPVKDRASISGRLDEKNKEYFVQDAEKIAAIVDPQVYNAKDVNYHRYYLADESKPDEPSNRRYWTRLNGDESGAAPRGNKRRDYWLVTALHLSYILEIKQKPPKFR